MASERVVFWQKKLGIWVRYYTATEISDEGECKSPWHVPVLRLPVLRCGFHQQQDASNVGMSLSRWGWSYRRVCLWILISLICHGEEVEIAQHETYIEGIHVLSKLQCYYRQHSVSQLHTFQFVQMASSIYHQEKDHRIHMALQKDGQHRWFLSIQLLKWTAQTQTDKKLTIKRSIIISGTPQIYITTMPIPSKCILLSDVADRFSKGGMNLFLR